MTDKVILSYENTRVNDSYQIKRKSDIYEFLNTLRKSCNPDMAVVARDLTSMVCEWRAHNFFYILHVYRSHTKDVDMERYQPWWREAFCRVVSFFYFWDL